MRMGAAKGSHVWQFTPSLSNETCVGHPLEGTFVGEGDMDVFGLYFKWRTIQTFHPNGTHDVDQVILADPMNVVPQLHCRGVPYVTDEQNCTVQIVRDDCMLAALNGMEIVKERGAWDPIRESLSFLLVVQVPRISAIQLDLSCNLKKTKKSREEVLDANVYAYGLL